MPLKSQLLSSLPPPFIADDLRQRGNQRAGAICGAEKTAPVPGRFHFDLLSGDFHHLFVFQDLGAAIWRAQFGCFSLRPNIVNGKIFGTLIFASKFGDVLRASPKFK